MTEDDAGWEALINLWERMIAAHQAEGSALQLTEAERIELCALGTLHELGIGKETMKDRKISAITTGTALGLGTTRSDFTGKATKKGRSGEPAAATGGGEPEVGSGNPGATSGEPEPKSRRLDEHAAEAATRARAPPSARQ